MVNLLLKPWHKKWWGILISIISTLILIIIIAFIFAVASEIKKHKSNTANQKLLPLSPSPYQGEGWGEVIEGNNYYWLGAAQPKVTIVEFVDFSCPMCKNSFTKIREIGIKYKNNVKIIIRDYPGFEHSLDLAMAARCAGEQGLFWLMHDKLFQNQGVYEKEQLVELANQIGADLTKFTNCFDNKKYLQQIQQDFTDAEKLEITGTPTWFINGQKIEGDIPYELFIQIVEELLQK